jgi:hypothetical protein
MAVAQAVVYIDPPIKKITTENSVAINFKIAAVNDLRSYSVKIRFDNSIVDFTSVARGGFLRSEGASTVILTQPTNPSSIIDNVVVDEAMFPDQGVFHTVSGNGTLFIVEFDILESGVSSITIEEVKIRDSDNNDMSVEFYSGIIKVMLPVKAKVFFEGPFSVNEMNTGLNQNGILPASQPYSASPWNYAGSESVPLNFFAANPNIVDWVLLELRTGTLSSAKIAEQACFILNNGSIVALDGFSPLYFEQPADDYYLVVTHRNHLRVMNALPYSVNKTSAQYDFTDSQSKAYGSGAMTEVAEGVFAMYAGDANGDGQLTGTDFNLFNPNFRSALSGYLNTDFNLDGSITGTDFNLFNPNFRNARSSQVP